MGTQTSASYIMRLVAVCCLIAIALAPVALVGPPTAHSAEHAATTFLYLPQVYKPSRPRIAFAHSCPNGWCYSTIYADGSGLTQIIGPEQLLFPLYSHWSPDRRKLALEELFMVNRSMYSALWVLDVGTLVRQQLTDYSLGVNYPAWSPDGSKLAFAGRPTGISGPAAGVYSISADGSGLIRLTDDMDYLELPTWSPDGQSIAFASITISTISRETSLHLVEADGTGLRTILDGIQGFIESITWSPDGRWLAFAVQQGLGDTSTSTIQLIHPDGTGYRQLAEGVSSYMSWSPDGRWLATWQLLPSAGGGIVALSPDGEATRVLAPGVSPPSTQHDHTPMAWSPDGYTIVFERSGDMYDSVISLVGADGTGLSDLAVGSQPTWLPEQGQGAGR